jgi:hypothetical protein
VPLHHWYDNCGVDPLSYEEDRRIGETVIERTGGFTEPRIYMSIYGDRFSIEDYWLVRWPHLSKLRRTMLYEGFERYGGIGV